VFSSGKCPRWRLFYQSRRCRPPAALSSRRQLSSPILSFERRRGKIRQSLFVSTCFFECTSSYPSMMNTCYSWTALKDSTNALISCERGCERTSRKHNSSCARANLFFSVGGEERKTEREISLSLSLARARDVTINQNDNNNSQTKKKKNNARRVSMQCLPLVPPSGCSRSRNTPSSPSKYPPSFLFSLLVCCVCLENWRHEKGRESFLLYNRDWNPKHKSSRKKNNTNHKKQKTEQKTLSFYNNDERKQHKSWIYWIGNDGRGFGRRPLQRRNCSVVEHLLHGPVATAFGFVPIVRRDGV